MSSSIVVLFALSGCRSERGLDADLLGDVAGWEDPTKASTVGARFGVAYPDFFGVTGPRRSLVFFADSATTATITQAGTNTSVAVDVAPGVTVVDEISARDWTFTGFAPPPGEGWSTTAGLIVETESPVELVAAYDVDDKAVTRVLPLEELGRNYRVATTTGGMFVVVAFHPDTEVYGPGSVEPVVFGAGEARGFVTGHADLDATRSWTVSANRPVAVFSGGAPGDPCSDGDFAWEQLPPIHRWATDYVATPLSDHISNELVLVADKDETTVTIDCTDVLSLGAGEVARLDLLSAAHVGSSRPVLALVTASPAACQGPDINQSPGFVAATPSVLQRTRALVAPLLDHLDAPPWFISGHDVAQVSDGTVDYYAVDDLSPLEGPPFNGIEFRARGPVTIAYSLGYDCVDCAQDLAVPASCP